MAQQAKPDQELQGGAVDRPSAPDSAVSSPHRTAPTSLNQLLDNSGVQNVPGRPLQGGPGKDATLGPTPHSAELTAPVAPPAATVTESNAISKAAINISTCSSAHVQPASISVSTPSINVNSSSTTPSPYQNLGSTPNGTPTGNPAATSAANTNSSPSPNSVSNTSTSSVSSLNPASVAVRSSPGPKPVPGAHSVIQIPASSAIGPNQITVFVTSNPITPGATSQAPPSTTMSNVMAVPSKNLRPQAPVPRPPQFITTTPVFINNIFQVPGVSASPSTTMVPHSVTMMGPIQVSSTSIQISTTPCSTQASGGTVASTQLVRSAGAGPVQIATTAAPAGTLNQVGGAKSEIQGETGTATLVKPGAQVQQASPHPVPPASSPYQPPAVSTPPSSSPLRKSPMSPPPQVQIKSKPVQAVGGMSSSAEVQQQVFHPTTTTTTNAAASAQIEANASNTTPSSVSSPAVPLPGQVAPPASSQTPGPTPPSPVSSTLKAGPGPAQTPSVSLVGSTTSVSAAPPVQNTVPSVVPIVPGPGAGPDVGPTTSPPTPNAGGAPPAQSDPPLMEPPAPPVAAASSHPEVTQTTQTGNYTIITHSNDHVDTGDLLT